MTINGGPWDEDTVTFATSVMFGESTATDVEGGNKNNKDEYTSIIAISPPHDAGPVDITVITPDSSERKGAFTYYNVVVNSVNPEEGPKGGNIAVIIKGEDFTDVVEAVKFGEKAARFAVISQSEILAVVPSVKIRRCDRNGEDTARSKHGGAQVQIR